MSYNGKRFLTDFKIGEGSTFLMLSNPIITVENGCLVFAVLSAIVTILALLACSLICVLKVIGITSIEELYILVLRTLLVCILLWNGFIFSVVLFNGTRKRRPGQVKAYFIYGVVIEVISVVSCIIFMVYIPKNAVLYGLSELAGCVIYSLILWMVYETYVKMSASVVYLYNKEDSHESGKLKDEETI